MLLTATGSGIWIVPSDWNNSANTIEAIGGGGGGTNGASGGGGAGGAYAKINNIALVSGSNIVYSVGVGGTGDPITNNGSVPAPGGGDTWFNGSSLSVASVGAKGAAPAAYPPGNTCTPATGGDAASSVGTVKYSGGNGGCFANSSGWGGAGGGGAAGPHGAGNPGATTPATNIGSAGGSGDNGLGGTGGAGSTSTSIAGSAGGSGSEWTSNPGGVLAGSGGGGGGGASDSVSLVSAGGPGGNYGSGGGAGAAAGQTAVSAGGNGRQGIIVISYTGTVCH